MENLVFHRAIIGPICRRNKEIVSARLTLPRRGLLRRVSVNDPKSLSFTHTPCDSVDEVGTRASPLPGSGMPVGNGRCGVTIFASRQRTRRRV